MKNRNHRLWAILVGIMLVTGTSVADAQNVSSLSPDRPVAKRHGNPEEWCIKPIGDFDGDGTLDYAISMSNAYPRVAYIYTGGEITPSDIDPATLATDPFVVVLRGSAAAPFMCVREFVKPAGPKRNFRALQAPLAPDRTVRALADGTSPVGRPPSYRLVALDAAEPYPYGYPYFKGINAQGHAVGELNGRAVWFDRVDLRNLGTLGGYSSTAFDINHHGDIVGVSLTGEEDEYGLISSPFIYDGFGMESLGIRFGAANKINDNDQIVGGMMIEIDGMRLYRAFLHEADRARELGTLGGPYSEAHSIDALGRVVGEAQTFIAGTDHPSTRAFIYSNGAMKDLGSLGHTCSDYYGEGPESCYEFSVATDINNKGRIVGFSTTDTGYPHAFLIDKGIMHDLGALGGQYSWAYAINDSGQIVGTALDDNVGSYSAFLYDQGTMHKLHELIVNLPDASTPPTWPRDINDFGQIVGDHFILDPIYEQVRPGTEFAFQESLGKAFRFEYWISTDRSPENPCAKTSVRMQVKIETTENHKLSSRRQKYSGRWMPAGHLVSSKRWDNGWRQAGIVLPKELRGRNATIRIRTWTVGSACEPIVHMRHFNMHH